MLSNEEAEAASSSVGLISPLGIRDCHVATSDARKLPVRHCVHVPPAHFSQHNTQAKTKKPNNESWRGQKWLPSLFAANESTQRAREARFVHWLAKIRLDSPIRPSV